MVKMCLLSFCLGVGDQYHVVASCHLSKLRLCVCVCFFSTKPHSWHDAHPIFVCFTRPMHVAVSQSNDVPPWFFFASPFHGSFLRIN